MDNIVTISYVNIAIESVSIAFMAILLIACILRKNSFPTTKYIIALSTITLFILILQIPQWWANIELQSGEGLGVPLIVFAFVFTFDYALVYWSSFATYLYLNGHTKFLGKNGGVRVKENKTLTNFIIIWGICCQIAMFICTLRGLLFSYDGNGNLIYLPLYALFLILGDMCMVICIVMTIMRRKILGVYDTLIFIVYCVVIIAIYPISIINNSSIAYIVTPFMVYILYLGISIRRDREYLSQQSLIAQREAEIEKSNMQIMVSQIQPHFLYNTLSVIDYLCGKDVELAREAINSFSEYLRMNMESLKSDALVPFEKELEHTKTYLWIEKMRFPDILNIEYDIAVTDFNILPLTLQPIAENAVKHGIRGREDGGTVKISTYRDGGWIVVSVEDDGIGFDTDKEPDDGRIHVGIENVRKRLELTQGGRLEIKSTPGVGTKAVVIIGGAPKGFQ